MIRRHALLLVFLILSFVPCCRLAAQPVADLCVVRNGRFLCDTAGDGGTAELRLRFGLAGEPAFLADLNGDGRADPCVFRDLHFLCDTAHDGGAAESESFRFDSLPADAEILLGDVDGEEDSGADPCYRAGTQWVCLVWNPFLGVHQNSWTFGTGTGRALLGDVDGNGLADFCVFRQGLVVCHAFDEQTGVYNTLSFDLRASFTPGGTTPLLDDVNGDGRADPCMYNSGELVCGIFPPGGGLPQSLIRRTFGVAGDIAVLGDVDGL
jgi:hypothetical protein